MADDRQKGTFGRGLQKFISNNLPYKSNTINNNLHGIGIGYASNNGSATGDADAYITENGTTMYFTLNGNWQGWTTSGTKGAVFGGWYLID